MQLTFGDAEYNGKRKQTRRKVFLAEMYQVVPWKDLLALIEPQYPKSGQPGRQPYRLETMLRIHFLQTSPISRRRTSCCMARKTRSAEIAVTRVWRSVRRWRASASCAT